MICSNFHLTLKECNNLAMRRLWMSDVDVQQEMQRIQRILVSEIHGKLHVVSCHKQTHSRWLRWEWSILNFIRFILWKYFHLSHESNAHWRRSSNFRDRLMLRVGTDYIYARSENQNTVRILSESFLTCGDSGVLFIGGEWRVTIHSKT